MTINLQYLDDLARVRITLSGYPDGEVRIERSINQLYWEIVRGAVALPISAGAAQVDDYEFIDGVENFWRAVLASTEDNMDVFDASGTWNKPAGLVAALVVAIGAGGAGGGAPTTGASQAAVGAGGGSGQLRWAVIPASSLGATETVTIGAAGAGASGAAGGAGGNTSFGAHVVANGGSGGGASSASGTQTFALGGVGGTGGAGTGGGLSAVGNDGTCGLVGVSGAIAMIGNGAPGFFGGGRRHSSSSTGANGLGAGSPGAGGSGGFNFASQGTARSGGGGGTGRVMVIHFFDEVV